MYSIGSLVSYRSEGVCKISDIRYENFGSAAGETLYYVLSPIGDERSTFFIPTNNESLVSMMRKLLSAQEITELVRSAAAKEPAWIADSKPRGAHFKEVLANGERLDLVFMIHMVEKYRREQLALGKKIYLADLNALKRASKLLFDEFSMVIPLASPDDLISFIEQICEENIG